MATIEELRLLLAKLKSAKAPSPELDGEIAKALHLFPSNERTPPPWTASVDEALNLFHQLLPARPMQIVNAGDDGYVCTVELYGTMPATPPYAVHFSNTAAMAVLAGLIETLIAVEIDYWS